MPTLPAHTPIEPFLSTFSLFLVPFDGTDPVRSEPTVAQLDQKVAITASSAGIVFGGALDLNGSALILDADGDSYIDSSADDVVDIYLNGAKDFEFSANTLTAMSGSSIATNTIAETTATSGVTIDGLRIKDAAVTPAVGGAAWADLRNCATAEGRTLIADNLAEAYAVREGTTNYISVVTTNASEGVEVRGLRNAQSTATAITGATTLTLADSGGIWTVAQSSAYDIDLPSPTSGAGLRFLFQLVSPGAFNVTLTVAGSAATFEGILHNDVTGVVPATGSTFTFASGTAILGDYIEVISTGTGKYFARAASSAAGGITIA